MKQKKRFIAGARCPSCSSEDSLRWWVDNRIEMVECVSCDFLDKRTPQSMQTSAHSEQEMIAVFKPE